MAKQIITLGIGPIDSLTPFILSGLDVATLVASDRLFAPVPFRDKRAAVPYRDKRVICQ